MGLNALLSGSNKALAKLTILSFKNKKPYIIPAGLPFVAMYNPTTFSTSHGTSYVKKPTSDKLVAKLEAKNQSNRTVKVDLLLDATGASPGSGVVGAALTKGAQAVGGVDLLVANFFAATQLPTTAKFDAKGFVESHQPNLLRIIWGAGLFFECTLQSATVNYNLFDRTGRALRATISATFLEAPSATALAKIKNFLSSPDVTKTYTVKAGDNIYNLAQSEYGEESFYLQIAQANDLKNYRKLVPGQTLIFPPVNKDEEVEE